MRNLVFFQQKQLDKILYFAANNPQTFTGMVKEPVRAVKARTEKLFEFDFRVVGKPVESNSCFLPERI